MFVAIQKKENKLFIMNIYKDYQYTITVDNMVFEEGKSLVDNDKIILSQNPASSLNTLIRNREYKIFSDKICRIKYVQLNTDANRRELVKPIEEIDNLDCFEIKKINR
jgi:hypothetical protein